MTRFWSPNMMHVCFMYCRTASTTTASTRTTATQTSHNILPSAENWLLHGLSWGVPRSHWSCILTYYCASDVRCCTACLYCLFFLCRLELRLPNTSWVLQSGVSFTLLVPLCNCSGSMPLCWPCKLDWVDAATDVIESWSTLWVAWLQERLHQSIQKGLWPARWATPFLRCC